jgi:NTE family protein
MPQADPLLDHVMTLLQQSRCFPLATRDDLASVAGDASWFSVPGGSTLFKEREPSDSLYLLLSGLFGAYVADRSGGEALIARIGSGEMVGEMGCVTGEPRTATIRALRSSEVLRISRDRLEKLASRNPDILMSLCSTVIGRMQSVQKGKPDRYWPRTFCVLPNDEEVDARTFSEQFTAALGANRTAFLVTQDTGQQYTSDALSALETHHENVVYLADTQQPAWSRLCLRQADAVLVIARGRSEPKAVTLLGQDVQSGIPVELVLLWDRKIEPSRTIPWLRLLRPQRHAHVRSSADIGRLARVLTGKALGLVLSGGGARGFAHVGVAKALLEQGIAIDTVVGTSIGAVIGAAIATEWDYATMVRRIHEFSRIRLLSQLTFPVRSLLSGRGLRASLDDWFGESEIEETPIPYACITTDLSLGTMVVHRRGKLRTWTRGSSSIPGVFPPVIDEEAIHIDGGVLNNLPTDVIREMGAGYVVAVDVASNYKASVDHTAGRTERIPSVVDSVKPSILDLLIRVSMISSNARATTLRQQCDLLLVPQINLGLMNFRGYQAAIDSGYKTTKEKISDIQQGVNKLWVSRSSRQDTSMLDS